MITLFRTDQVYAIEQLKAAVIQHIRSLPHKISPIGTPLKILRFEFPCQPMDLFAWLHNNHHIPEKIYWSDRNGDFAMAGLGVTDTLYGTGGIDHQALFEYFEDHLSADNAHLRYYGGFAFSPTSLDRQWENIGSYRFVVPRFEFITTNATTIFAFNIAMKDIDEERIGELLRMLEGIDFSTETVYRPVPKIRSRRDVPDKRAWDKIFDELALKKFSHEKIVLARKSIFEFDVAIRPSALMKHLKDKTPNCYHFCFQLAGHFAFLGATPECLYKRVRLGLESEAIAGTVKRGVTQHEEAHLARTLLNSSKYNLEHKYVVDAIRRSLKGICASLRADRNSRLLKLNEGQHLMTRFYGELNPDTNDEHILNALHPTPAVAGYPVPEALIAIEQLEPFKRGWYAGPVGYVGHEKSEFAVAIRSGLVDGHTLSLYAGAGIVEGSTADEEWQEIEAKIGNFIEVFNKK